MSDYLNQIFQAPPRLSGATEATVLPPTLAGQGAYPSDEPCARLRKAQLCNILRAWNLFQPKHEQLTHPKLVELVHWHRMNGDFDRKPVAEYFLRQAAYNADEIMQAKTNGGAFTRKTPGGGQTAFRCLALEPWPHGDPDAPAAATKPAKEAPKPKRASEIQRLRAEAKQLGINAFGLSAKRLREAIIAAQASGEPLPPEAA